MNPSKPGPKPKPDSEKKVQTFGGYVKAKNKKKIQAAIRDLAEKMDKELN